MNVPIQALAFDAVGTLLYPEPPAWEVYASVGQRFSSTLVAKAIRSRFRTAFARQEQLDAVGELRTSEAREVARWRAIVAEVLDDVTEPEACFQALYQHFSLPAAWRTNPEAEIVLPALQRRGYRLALASNYDERLRPVAHGIAELAPIDCLVISSEVGWRKPAPGFFAAVCAQLGLPAEAVLFIGDDRANDFDGARQAGLPSLLYDPAQEALELGPARIGNLGELLTR